MNRPLTPMPGVVCRNLVKDFVSGSTKVQALRGISMNVSPGELTLVVGPSGCGKTTLISAPDNPIPLSRHCDIFRWQSATEQVELLKDEADTV